MARGSHRARHKSGIQVLDAILRQKSGQMGKPPENSHGNPAMKVWIQMIFLFKQTRWWTQVNQPLIVQGVTKLQKKLTRQDMAGQCPVSIWSRLGRFQKKHRHLVSLQVLIIHYTESPFSLKSQQKKKNKDFLKAVPSSIWLLVKSKPSAILRRTRCGLMDLGIGM